MASGFINFEKRSTVIQEITSDGKCVEHVTELPRIVDEAEERRRNLPEFKNEKWGKLSLTEQFQKNEEEKEEEREKEKKEYESEELELQKQLIREQRERLAEKKRVMDHDTNLFEEAMKERKKGESFTPQIKVRVIEKEKKTNKPEPVFISRKKGTAPKSPEKKPETITEKPAAPTGLMGYDSDSD